MHGGRARSVALAPAQAAPGPPARPAAVCWPLAAKWGQFAHGVLVAIWGDPKVGAQRGRGYIAAGERGFYWEGRRGLECLLTTQVDEIHCYASGVAA